MQGVINDFVDVVFLCHTSYLDIGKSCILFCYFPQIIVLIAAKASLSIL